MDTTESLLEGLRIRPISTEQTIRLRQSVLWPDKPELHVRLPEDDLGYHFGAFIASRDAPIAVISLFKEPPPASYENEMDDTESESPIIAARFRKFACDTVYQGHGTGTAVLQCTFTAAREQLGCNLIWCDARLSTAGWYERRGMARFGSVFFKSAVEYVCMMIQYNQ